MDTIEHFDKLLTELLQRHADDQKKIAQLVAENKDLKALHWTSNKDTNGSTEIDKNLKKTLTSDGFTELSRQISTYIREIDRCLTYFEQI
ncbi:hypothetical protein [Cardinium endosymbiont of Tipula unca]|uniref:hypothetical protein n=1 Tax=Cardinium endosymbiont of Tipula unca TaxID=3066216 RepID=UPI0030CB2A65